MTSEGIYIYCLTFSDSLILSFEEEKERKNNDGCKSREKTERDDGCCIMHDLLKRTRRQIHVT